MRKSCTQIFYYVLSLTASVVFSACSELTIAEESSQVDAQMCQKNRECLYQFVQINDLNDILLQDNYNRQITVQLAGVLPYSMWPKDLDETMQSYIQQGRSFLEQLAKNNKALLKPLKPISENQTTIAGYLYFHSPLDSPHYLLWEGKRPSEQSSWGGFNLSAMLIENGFTVSTYNEDMLPSDVNNKAAGHIERTLLDAEQFGVKNKKGLWNNKAFSEQLKAIAAQTR